MTLLFVPAEPALFRTMSLMLRRRAVAIASGVADQSTRSIDRSRLLSISLPDRPRIWHLLANAASAFPPRPAAALNCFAWCFACADRRFPAASSLIAWVSGG